MIRFLCILALLVTILSGIACQNSTRVPLGDLYENKVSDYEVGVVFYSGGTVVKLGGESSSLYISKNIKEKEGDKEINSFVFTPRNEYFMANSQFFIIDNRFLEIESTLDSGKRVKCKIDLSEELFMRALNEIKNYEESLIEQLTRLQ